MTQMTLPMIQTETTLAPAMMLMLAVRVVLMAVPVEVWLAKEQLHLQVPSAAPLRRRPVSALVRTQAHRQRNCPIAFEPL